MQDYSVCDWCGGHGLTIVPHPDFVVLGEWQPHHLAAGDGAAVYYTATVTCACSRGDAVYEHLGSLDTKPMKLDDYKARVLPDPFKVMAAAKADLDAQRMTGRIREAASYTTIRRETADAFEVPL